MSSQTIFNLVIGVAIVVLLIYRQLRARPVRGNQRFVLVLAVIGLIETVQYLQKSHAHTPAVIALAGSLALAAVFGAVRAVTVRIWTQDGQPWVQGSIVTASLWVLALAAHLGYDYLVGLGHDTGALGSATIVLYLAMTLGVQRLIVNLRAQRVDPSAVRRLGQGAI